MIRPLRSTPNTHSHLASVPDDHMRDEVRILREIVTALCERVELLEAHAALARPHLVGRTPG
jgi:hypothetical protein